MKKRFWIFVVLIALVVTSFPNKAYAALPTPTISTAYRKGNRIIVNWGRLGGISGYQVRYSLNEDMTDDTRIKVKGRKNKTTTIEQMDDSCNYYIQVRSYKYANEKLSLSKWSNKVCVLGWDEELEFAEYSAINSDGATIYYASGENASGVTVCVNAGHGTVGGNQVRTLCHPDGSLKVTGGSTAAGSKDAAAVSSGTTFLDGTSEASVNLKLAKELKKQLLAEGYNVLMIRDTKDIQLDNIARTVLANNYADYHIALHFDSTEANNGAFYISVPDDKTYKKMYPVSKNYKKHHELGEAILSGFKEKKIPIRGTGRIAIDLTQTSYSTIPSIDLEVGDRASKHDDESLAKIAEGITVGVKTLEK